jgi:hypothetical protein
MKILTCGCAPNCKLNLDGKGYVDGCGPHLCVTFAKEQPDLSNRIASCFCGRTAPSKDPQYLAFFTHKPSRDTDEFYCGCRGWD